MSIKDQHLMEGGGALIQKLNGQTFRLCLLKWANKISSGHSGVEKRAFTARLCSFFNEEVVSRSDKTRRGCHCLHVCSSFLFPVSLQPNPGCSSCLCVLEGRWLVQSYYDWLKAIQMGTFHDGSARIWTRNLRSPAANTKVLLQLQCSECFVVFTCKLDPLWSPQNTAGVAAPDLAWMQL